MPPRTFCFGEFRINERDRLLERGDEVVPLPRKVVDTLLLLLERSGQVVTKSELLAALWPDTHVDEGSLKQNISVLRKALGDEAEKARYIETIPRRGYRFIAPVSVRAAANRKQGRVAWRLSWTLPVIVAVGTAAVLYWSRQPQSLDSQVQPFTTYRGEELEPAFSPDGKRIAFVWDGDRGNFDIYIRELDAEQPVRITSHAASEASPAWAPDGRQIAFLRYSQVPGASGVMIADTVSGSVRQIAALAPLERIFDRHVDWSPNGTMLAIVDRPAPNRPYVIELLDIASGQRRRLTDPPSGSIGDTGPTFSPDGTKVLFRRSLEAGVADLYVVGTNGGEPTPVTRDGRYIAGQAWSPDGSSVLVSSARAGPLQLWRVFLSTRTPARETAAADDATFLAVDRSNGRIAFGRWFADTNIWRYDLSGREQPVPFIASTRADASPDAASAGSRIAFRSDRSGATEIWTAAADGSDQRRLTSFNGPLTGSPRISPDGRWIAFDSRPSAQSHIFVMPVFGGQPVRVTSGESNNALPAWSPDGRVLFFCSNRSGHWEVWQASWPATESRQHRVTQTGGFAPQVSPDGAWLYFMKSPATNGLYRLRLASGQESPVIPDLRSALWGNWAVRAADIVYVVPGRGETGEVRSRDLASGRDALLGGLGKPPFEGDRALAVSSDGRWLYYVQADQSGSDIFLINPASRTVNESSKR